MRVPSRTSLPRHAEIWVAVGIGVLIGLLVWGFFNGHSGLDRPPGETLAVRFFLILLMTWMLVAIDDAPAVGAALGPSALVSVGTVARLRHDREAPAAESAATV